MFITKKNFRQIPLFEQLSIKEWAEQRRAITYLGYQYAERYRESHGIDGTEYLGFYSGGGGKKGRGKPSGR